MLAAGAWAALRTHTGTTAAALSRGARLVAFGDLAAGLQRSALPCKGVQQCSAIHMAPDIDDDMARAAAPRMKLAQE